MFYPDLNRRRVYSTKANGDPFATYDRYRDEISEDCNHRCTYCDITLEEMGFEGMQLDHFQPQKHFPKRKSDPTNLVLSCPKCNRLKSSHWPPDGSGLFFIDPFETGRMQHFSIIESGVISPTDTQVASYQIELLSLNRGARIQARRKRIVLNKIKLVQQTISSKMKELQQNSASLKPEDISRELALISSAFDLMRRLN